MKRLLPYCLMVLFLLIAGTVSAKQSAPATRTAEQDQQFAYCWYAAWQAMEDSQYSRALLLLLQCEQLDPQDAMTQNYLGRLYDALGDRTRANAAFHRAWENDPAGQWRTYTSFLYKRGSEEQLPQAVRIAEQGIRLSAADEDDWETLRQLYMRTQQWKKAIKAQDHIDKLNGYDSYSALNRYRIYALWGKNQKAIGALNDYLRTDSTNLQLLSLRLSAYEQIGVRPRVLAEAYEQMLRLDPGNSTVLNNYAYLLAAHGGDLKRAEQMSQRALIEQPENPSFLDTYAWILHLRGQDTLAAIYIRKARSLTQDEPQPEIEAHYRQIIRQP